jgi:peptide/nickel transport system substrate-binding protein
MSNQASTGLARRQFLAASALGGATAVLAACAPAAAPTPTAAPKPAATTAPASPAPAASPAAGASPVASAVASPAAKPAANIRTGGQLKVAQDSGLLSLEPQLRLADTSETVWLAHDRLIAYDLGLTPQPMLAESWDMTPDAKSATFRLRRGVTWHNGRTLTSEDVKFSLLRVRDPKVGSGQYTAASNLFTTIETPDANTVVLKSEKGAPLMLDTFNELNIVDKEWAEGAEPLRKSNGTGPFKFVEWVQGDKLTYQRNPNYWQNGKPYLGSYQLSFAPDTQAMVLQLESGGIDVARIPPLNDFVRLRSNPRFQSITHPAGGSCFLVGCNVAKVPAFADKRVRQAFNFAIDRKRFTDSVLQGEGKPQSLPWADTSPYAEPAKNQKYPFDLDRARALLAEANFRADGLEIMPSPTDPSSGRFAEIFQSDLAKIGVNINILVLDAAAQNQRFTSGNYNGFFVTTQSQMQVAMGTILNSAVLRPSGNRSGYENPAWTRMVETVSAESDPVKLKALYPQVNDMLLDESFVMYMTPNSLRRLASARVKDMTPNLWGGWSHTDAWLES